MTSWLFVKWYGTVVPRDGCCRPSTVGSAHETDRLALLNWSCQSSLRSLNDFSGKWSYCKWFFSRNGFFNLRRTTYNLHWFGRTFRGVGLLPRFLPCKQTLLRGHHVQAEPVFHSCQFQSHLLARRNWLSLQKFNLKKNQFEGNRNITITRNDWRTVEPGHFWYWFASAWFTKQPDVLVLGVRTNVCVRDIPSTRRSNFDVLWFGYKTRKVCSSDFTRLQNILICFVTYYILHRYTFPPHSTQEYAITLYQTCGLKIITLKERGWQGVSNLYPSFGATNYLSQSLLIP